MSHINNALDNMFQAKLSMPRIEVEEFIFQSHAFFVVKWV